MFKKVATLLLGITILIPSIGVSADDNSRPTYSKSELKKAAETSNMSVEELDAFLQTEWKEYKKAKKNWKETINTQKKELANKIKKQDLNVSSISSSEVETYLTKLEGKDYTFNSETGQITFEDNTSGSFSTLSTSSSLGTIGDVLVTLDASSSSNYIGGHAAIVSNYSNNWTLESFMVGFSEQSPDKDGVMWQINNWKTRYDSVAGYWVTSSESGDYNNAAQYAENQLHEPYNINFFDVWDTERWYCSQLVWRAWYEQGEDLDGTANAVVMPKDLTTSDHVYAFYDSL